MITNTKSTKMNAAQAQVEEVRSNLGQKGLDSSIFNEFVKINDKAEIVVSAPMDTENSSQLAQAIRIEFFKVIERDRIEAEKLADAVIATIR